MTFESLTQNASCLITNDCNTSNVEFDFASPNRVTSASGRFRTAAWCQRIPCWALDVRRQKRWLEVFGIIRLEQNIKWKTGEQTKIDK